MLSSFSLLLFPLLTFSQTGAESEAILTKKPKKTPGTSTRGLHDNVQPVKPEPLNSGLPQPVILTPEEPAVIEQAVSKAPTTPEKAATLDRLVPKAPAKPQVLPREPEVATPKSQVRADNTQVQQNTDVKDTILADAYRKSVLAYYQSIERRNIANTVTFDSVTSYYAWALKNRQHVITRQQSTGSAIFILVISVVLAGLIFSGIQFYIALKSANLKGTFTDTSVKASLSGVEVSSSVLGVIILALSIVFFYLYLTNVYPLVSLDQIPAQSAMKSETVP